MKKILKKRKVTLGSYAALLVTVTLYIVIYSVKQEKGIETPWVSYVLFPVIFFATMSTAAASTRQLVLLVVLFVIVSGLDIGRATVGGETFLVLSHVLHIVFLLYVMGVILSHVFRTRAVTSDMILGSICAYLVMALLFNEGFALIESLIPGSFEGLTDVRKDGGYFSLVTLSTLGYGDVVPVKAVARSLSALAAVAGQFYIAVIVARLVAARVTSVEREAAKRTES